MSRSSMFTRKIRFVLTFGSDSATPRCLVSAATLAFARVFAFATIVTRATAALAFASVFAFAVMLCSSRALDRCACLGFGFCCGLGSRTVGWFRLSGRRISWFSFRRGRTT